MTAIIGPALMTKDGFIYGKPAPYRHGHVIQMMRDSFGLAGEAVHTATQGFMALLDDEFVGRFVDRFEAMKIAKANNLVRHRPCGHLNTGNELFSEDLW